MEILGEALMPMFRELEKAISAPPFLKVTARESCRKTKLLFILMSSEVGDTLAFTTSVIPRMLASTLTSKDSLEVSKLK